MRNGDKRKAYTGNYASGCGGGQDDLTAGGSCKTIPVRSTKNLQVVCSERQVSGDKEKETELLMSGSVSLSPLLLPLHVRLCTAQG